jgi:anti-anti-sigma regulatory factor
MALEINRTSQDDVTILQLVGKIDGSNFNQLIDQALSVYQAGTRKLILDLSQLTYLSSAGLSAIHKTALIFRGQQLPEREASWTGFRISVKEEEKGGPNNVKLLSPQKNIENLLDISGFKSLFEVYFNLEKAVASF